MKTKYKSFKKYLMYLLVAAISFVSLGMSSARAQTYTYTGNPFTIQDGGISFWNGSAVVGQLTGTFDTLLPLPANMAITDITSLVTAISFRDHSLSETLWTSLSNIEIFEIGTANGNINDWNIALVVATGVGGCPANIRCEAISDNLVGDVSDESLYNKVKDLQHGKAVLPGTWTTTPSAAPGILFAGALALVLFVLRRNNLARAKN